MNTNWDLGEERVKIEKASEYLSERFQERFQMRSLNLGH